MTNGPCPLRLGDPAPDFEARSTAGPVRLSAFRGRWLLLVSHPADFTPVCTSEFVALERARPRFEALGCDLMAVSVDSLFAHYGWLRAIRDRFGVEVRFPIVEDPTMVIARAYGMADPDQGDSSAVRSSFFIGPDGRVRAITCYPAALGRSVEEMLRVIAALQAADAAAGLAPADWQPGTALLRAPAPDLDSVFASRDPVDWFFGDLAP